MYQTDGQPISVDIETTGFPQDKKLEPVEIIWISISKIGGDETGKNLLDIKFKPKYKSTQSALNAHKLKLKDLENEKPFTKIDAMMISKIIGQS